MNEISVSFGLESEGRYFYFKGSEEQLEQLEHIISLLGPWKKTEHGRRKLSPNDTEFDPYMLGHKINQVTNSEMVATGLLIALGRTF
ncbi:hypothetical protein OAG1_17570 [Agarivorans sp. OAG1]|uniref:hypothetical protein n=1 Tax=Agarivorans sp. OAG1 TaxID=3082387 RepID=UPI002B293D80|nr:hypothetical protein OAG1_17570 [Agarivorans sp. OAG1]